MNLTFSDEQRMLADGVGRYLDQERDFHVRQAQLAEGVTLAPKVWRHLAEQGLLALPRSEAVDGMGGGIADVVAIAMRFGSALLTEPYLATVILAGAALEAAGTDEAIGLLARVASGDAIAAFAHDEAVSGAPANLIDTNALAKDRGYVLNGTKPFVLAAGEAQHVVVTAKYDDGVALFLVDAASNGLSIETFLTIDGRRAGRIRLDDVVLPESALLVPDAADVIEQIVTDAVIYLAAESVGAMDALSG